MSWTCPNCKGRRILHHATGKFTCCWGCDDVPPRPIFPFELGKKIIAQLEADLGRSPTRSEFDTAFEHAVKIAREG